MIFGVNDGHCLTGKGTGAKGVKSETDMNRLVGKRLRAMLKEKGHTVVDCTVDKSNNDLADIVAKANRQHLDLFISLHLNCFSDTSANGVETFSYAKTGKGHEYAVKIQNELVKNIGWKERGKKEANFYVLKNTKASAVLVELGFCSNKRDMELWNTEKIARALFRAITGSVYKEEAKLPVVEKPNQESTYRVSREGKQIGAFSKKENILKEVEKAITHKVTLIEVRRI